MIDMDPEVAMRLNKRAAFYLAGSVASATTLWAWGADNLRDAVSGAYGALHSCAGWSCWPALLPDGLLALMGLALLGLGVAAAYYFAIPAARGAFLKSTAVVQRSGEAEKRRAIVLTLSDLPLKPPPGRPDEIALADKAVAEARTAFNDVDRLAVLDKLCDPKGAWAGWRWQQPLRLLRHNFHTVKTLVFVLSEEAIPQYKTHMLPLLSHVMRPGTRILPDPSLSAAVDLSDYNAVTKALDAGCETALRETPCKARDLCIDITSGTKAYSAAATVKTLNSTAVFSYVETMTPYEVITYDTSLRA